MVSGVTSYSQNSPSGAVLSGFYRGDGRTITDHADVSENKNGVTSRTKSDSSEDSTTSREKLELSQEAQEIRELQLRDREVRAHEAAHAAAGGAYAGSPTYTFEHGPDGHSYAVGGSVSIDTSPIKGDPQATLQKMEQVRAAALAPAQPSAQDMKIAQKAQALAAKARVEMVQQRQSSTSHQATSVDPSPVGDSDKQNSPRQNSQVAQSVDTSSSASGLSRLDIYS